MEPRLVDDRPDTREREGHDRVEPRRTLAAAQHQQVNARAALGETLRGWRQRHDLASHRIADHLRVQPRRKAAREGREHAIGESGQRAIGEPGDGVLLMDQQRLAQQPGGEPARAGDEAAETHYELGPGAADHGERLP